MKRITSTWLALLGLIILPLHVAAGDLSSDVRKGVHSPENNDGGYIEFGASLSAFKSAVYGVPYGNRDGDNKGNITLALSINSRWQYKNFFVETFAQSLEGFTLGYNFIDTANWAVDIVSLEENGELSDDISHDLKGYKKRDGDYMMGPRTTAYFDNYIFQLHALTDVSGVHNGQMFSAKLARNWQYKNWNYHAIIGTSYRSKKIADYYYSVQPEDVTEKFTEFHAQAGFTETIELGVAYPISEKWVFRGLMRHVELDRQWEGSPIILANHADMLEASINYVFK